MASIQEITVPVAVKMEIDESTAEACLKIVELYVNQHPNLDIIARTNKNGTVNYQYENKTWMPKVEADG